MRNLFFILVLATWSCKSQTQTINTEIIQNGKKPYLLGKINKKGLITNNYKEWFLSNFDEYKPNQETIKKIADKLKKYDILVFMATWCGDSRREVPRFYKVLEAAKYPMSQLSVIAVSREPDMYKQSPNHEEKELNIHRVPTFILYKKGKEINRIVEHPVSTLEDDVLNILEDNYLPNYNVVDTVNSIIDDEYFYEKALKNLPNYKEKAKNVYALNTYSRILATTNRQDKALEVLKLNAKIFPNNPIVYVSLGNFYATSAQKNKALKSYKKAYKINPENAKLKARIDQLKSELISSNN